MQSLDGISGVGKGLTIPFQKLGNTRLSQPALGGDFCLRLAGIDQVLDEVLPHDWQIIRWLMACGKKHPYVVTNPSQYSAAMNTMGARIKALRKARRLSQEQLAERIGVTQPAISQIEKGKTESLSGDVLAGLCRVLHVSQEMIMSGSPDGMDFESSLLESELLQILRSLDSSKRNALIAMARGLATSAPDPAPTPSPPVQQAKKRNPAKV